MGNEILSLVQQDSKKQGQIHVTKSVIRPIRYGHHRPPEIEITHNIKEEYKHHANSLDHHHIQIRQSQSFPQHKNPEQSRYETGNNMKMVRQLSQNSESSLRKLAPLRNDYQFEKEIPSTSEIVKPAFKKPAEQRLPLKSLQKEEGQILIEYLPIVSKMISILKPFQKQLSLLDQTKVKKIRLKLTGDTYKGQLNDLNQPNGFGMLVKENGSVVIGKFQNGLIHGQAVFIYSNGSYFKGKMVDSMANDLKGQFNSLDMTYIGGFLNNSFHGSCEQLGNDYHFKGSYENNIRKKGVLSWGIKQNKQKQKPRISSSDQDEKGLKYKQKDSQQLPVPQARDFIDIPEYNYSYSGQFDIHQLFTGKGTLKDPQGIYTGDFYRGAKHGKGQYQYESHIKYVGEYDSDKRSGYGILMNCDNTIAYQGYWSHGLPNGKGCSYDENGRKTECQFVDGLPGRIVPLD